MDAWVIVLYPVVRDVFVDDVLFGETNTKFFVQLGRHRFDLDTPKDYKPDSITTLIDGTPDEPTVVQFLPI